uniref:Uncharacterized protein n=1 Tax=candidate division WOR-3 bacterium TaxID=2052148 RepID=A0A7C2K503_UNCW3
MSVEITSSVLAKIWAQATEKLVEQTFKVVEKSSYGSARVSLFTIVDFSEPPRLDEWKIELNRILTNIGFRKDGNEYIASDVRIKDIVSDYLYLPLESEDSEEERDDVFDFDNGILYVKRMKIYAIPEKIDKKCLSKAVSKLTDIVEGFMKYFNFSKTFFGVRIVFENSSEAGKFKEKIHDQLNRLGISQIYQSDNMVDVIVLSIAKAKEAFEIIENELFGGLLSKIKRLPLRHLKSA